MPGRRSCSRSTRTLARSFLGRSPQATMPCRQCRSIDIGDMASSLVVIDPEMTEQVSVSTSNMSADQAFGPVVVSTISRAGGSNYHGEGYFDARNNVFNANGWQQNNTK